MILCFICYGRGLIVYRDGFDIMWVFYLIFIVNDDDLLINYYYRYGFYLFLFVFFIVVWNVMVKGIFFVLYVVFVGW